MQDNWKYENWVLNRLMTDIPAYLIGIVSTSLFFQWYQTYCILKNPQGAIKTITNNTSHKIQISVIFLYTVFLISDLVIVSIDYNKMASQSKLDEQDPSFKADLVSLIFQSILAGIIFIAFNVLFIQFLFLIREKPF